MPAVPTETPVGKPPSVVIGKTQPSPTQLRAQDTIFFHQVRDRVPLLMIQPAEQDREPYLERRHVHHGPSLYHGSKTGPSLVLRIRHFALETREGPARLLESDSSVALQTGEMVHWEPSRPDFRVCPAGLLKASHEAASPRNAFVRRTEHTLKEASCARRTPTLRKDVQGSNPASQPRSVRLRPLDRVCRSLRSSGPLDEGSILTCVISAVAVPYCGRPVGR